MDLAFIRRGVALLYTLIILLFIGFGFSYTNQMDGSFWENNVHFTERWRESGKVIAFPYSKDGEFTIENTLPDVFGDQMLIIHTYYDYYKVYIEDSLVQESRKHEFLGHTTVVGQKEIWIPLEEEYSGKKISIVMNMQEALYGSSMSDAFISTRSGYGIMQLKKNLMSIILYIVFTVTGVAEIIIAGYFILKRAALIRKLTFEALFYAGCFSIVSGQWIINETRIPYIIFGNITGFSVLNIIVFLIMPLLFLEMSRALFIRIGRVDNIIDGIFALSLITLFTLVYNGVFDWGHLVYFAHIFDAIVMVIVGYYSFKSMKEESNLSIKTGIAIANCIFLLLAALAIFDYINNVTSNYIIIALIDLLIYIMVQVGLIYRRIGLSVKEEKEFAEAKVFAFSDELTKIGNRRHFFNVIDDFEKSRLPNDLTYITIDVNRLKYYNDNMGHEAGDELLKGTAECMQKAFSSSSTSTISRIGGDEFGILLVASQAEVNKRIVNFKSYLEKWHGKYINGISAAIGAAVVKEEMVDSIEKLARIADERMYVDKKNFYETSGFDRRDSH